MSYKAYKAMAKREITQREALKIAFDRGHMAGSGHRASHDEEDMTAEELLKRVEDPITDALKVIEEEREAWKFPDGVCPDQVDSALIRVSRRIQEKRSL